MQNNIFQTIAVKKPKSNSFNLTHDVKLTLDMGQLVPVLCMECLPGDRFTLAAQSLLRFAPLIAPVMHRMDCFIHYWFVPNRILWSQWENYVTNTDNTIPKTPPQVQITTGPDANQFAWNSLIDYMGIPNPGAGKTYTVSALPFAAYNKIFNDYYRDENLVDELKWQLNNGLNTPTELDIALQLRAWEHDYFTSALPFAQKGAAVDIPLGDVHLKEGWFDPGNPAFPNFQDGNGDSFSGNVTSESGGGQPFIDIAGGHGEQAYDPAGSLVAGDTTINDLRRAYALQRWLELNARGGTRYTEQLYAHFGVKSPDSRLQRAEYITGSKSAVVISEVLNTAGVEDSPPQGAMAGHGITVNEGRYGNYYCQEHGYVIGIMSVMPKTAYQQGIPKHFLKINDNLEYYWPMFANIGEQAIVQQEVYADTLNPDGVFGYTPRYAEYKYMPSRVAGDFRNTLNFWHLGRIFSTDPALNSDFVQCNATKRVFAVEDPSQNQLYCHVLNKIRARRPMPIYGSPI